MTKLTPNHSFRIVRAISVLTMIALVIAAFSTATRAQTYTVLKDFIGSTTGSNPVNPGLLAQGQDGNLYGTLQIGGKFGDGTVFVFSPSTGVNVVYNFGGPDGHGPTSGLHLGFDGNFYGSTYLPYSPTYGEVYKVTPSGALTVLYQFTNGADGAYPWTPPVQAPDGNLYGVTNNGTVPTAYRITPSGVFTVIATLPSRTVAPLILGTDGNLYGTTQYGGTFNGGTIFQLTTKGKLKIVHSFDNNSYSPVGPVMQGADGKLYGTTAQGGTSYGVVYECATGGAYKVLHNFAYADGTTSLAGLVQGSDSYLYGVSSAGGTGYGTFFKVNTKGTVFSVLHNFDKTNGGDSPLSTPFLHTSGVIYGMNSNGTNGYGNFYSMDVGLKPFASLFVIWSGKVGTQVGILGQGFNTATGVKFGSGLGTFEVISDTYMLATAEPGATTGTVTVLEPGGNLVTPQTFKVIPTISSVSPVSGPVGTSVTITGMSLSQATAVTFGGVKAASFTVNSDTQVTAAVPTGAKTGKIGVTTKGGHATSAKSFTVN